MKKKSTFYSLKDLFSGSDIASHTHKKFAKKDYELFDFTTLIKSWEEIVGHRLSEHAIPLKIKNQALYLLTDHPAFSDQLKFMEGVLIQKITKHFPVLKSKIKRIYFQMNSAHFNEKKEQSPIYNEIKKAKEIQFHPESPRYKELKEVAVKQFAEINDEKLREQFISIFIQAHYEQN